MIIKNGEENSIYDRRCFLPPLLTLHKEDNSMRKTMICTLLTCFLLVLCSCADSNTSPTQTVSSKVENTQYVTEAPATSEEEPVTSTASQETEESQIPAVTDTVPETPPESTTNPVPETETVPDDEDTGILTPTQRNSINMLNYMTVLAQNVNEAKGNQLLLESAYSALVNDIYPNAVDTKTQAQITSLMDTIDEFRMISVKRERLEFIYEQNRAQALRKAIPNPVGLLSAVQSKDLLKTAASVLYMAVDAASSYEAATSQADLQFIKDGWELDDAESAALHNSTKNALMYMFSVVRDYNLPGDYALNRESVESFVQWAGKPTSQNIGKIAWLEDHESTYGQFGPYWLELAKDYYEAGSKNTDYYDKCLSAVAKYESVSSRIFRKDIDFAKCLPMAIISAKETMERTDYVETAKRYCELIMSNTKDTDWELRYFTAQTYLDLYAQTNEADYIERAYKIAFSNVNELVDAQRSLNASYLAEYKEIEPQKDATKRQKDEIKSYNKLMKEEREIALPPVNEALYLNCDLLFALASERNIPDSEKNRIEDILHVNGERLFLTKSLDDRFWFTGDHTPVLESEIAVEFDGDELTLPAVCVTDRSVVYATVTGANGSTTILNDWVVTEVDRSNASDSDTFLVTYESELGDDYDYEVGDSITITVIPVEETPENCFEFKFTVNRGNIWFVSIGTEFERAG